MIEKQANLNVSRKIYPVKYDKLLPSRLLLRLLPNLPFEWRMNGMLLFKNSQDQRKRMKRFMLWREKDILPSSLINCLLAHFKKILYQNYVAPFFIVYNPVTCHSLFNLLMTYCFLLFGKLQGVTEFLINVTNILCIAYFQLG